MLWSYYKNGEFLVKTLCEVIEGSSPPISDLLANVVDFFWKNFSPLKVTIIVRLAILGKLNTRDNLVRKGIVYWEILSSLWLGRGDF